MYRRKMPRHVMLISVCNLQFMDDDAGAFAHRLRPRQPTKAQLEQAKARKKEELQARRELSKQKITARRRETYIASLERAPEVFNPKVPVGTGFHELRRARVAYDLTTGAPGNPDGPWKTTQRTRPIWSFDRPGVTYDIRDVDTTTGQLTVRRHEFSVPLALDDFKTTTFESVLWLPKTHRVTPAETSCIAPLVTQFTGQCYFAATLNTLLAMPEFKGLMQRVFARLPEPLLAIVRHESTIPAEIPLPLGLALLQLFYKQYNNSVFTPTPVVALLERRLQNDAIKSGGGGMESAAIITVLSALGLSWACSKDVPCKESIPESVLFDIMNVQDHLHEVQPVSKHGRRSAGALLGIPGHAFAALDCNMLFDSNRYAKYHAWRLHPLITALIFPLTERLVQAAVVYVSRKINTDKTADAVIRSCLAMHDYWPFVQELCWTFNLSTSNVFTSFDMQFDKHGIINGPRVFKFDDGNALFASFVDGKLQNTDKGSPAVVVVEHNDTLVLLWRPSNLGMSRLRIAAYKSSWDGRTNIAAIYVNDKKMDTHDLPAPWLPPLESLPSQIRDIPFVRDIFEIANRPTRLEVYSPARTKYSAL
jgi:hypothetical protein